MYRDCSTCVKTTNGNSGMRIGVNQELALSPYLFILVLDEILKGVIKEVPWCMSFADDMVVIANSAKEAN